MKIIYIIRPDYLEKPGGDTIQLLQTKVAIEKERGAFIQICTTRQEVEQYAIWADLAHVFNLQTAEFTLSMLLYCKENGLPTLLSTIYWDFIHASYINAAFNIFGFIPTKNLEVLVPMYGKALNALSKFSSKSTIRSKSYIEKRRAILETSDWLLPNSTEELQIVANEFGFDIKTLQQKTFIIPNAVEKNKISCSSEGISQRNKSVLQVGRIEPIKNQLGVLKALYHDHDIPIIFIGRVCNSRYFQYLTKLANKRGNVQFIGQLPYEKVQQYYREAAVHVLPSFRESPGLSTLEAYFHGARIVTSDSEFCPTKYYRFDKIASICNPYDVASIRKAIMNAFEADKTEFDEGYINFISYENVAKKTVDAYEACLA